MADVAHRVPPGSYIEARPGETITIGSDGAYVSRLGSGQSGSGQPMMAANRDLEAGRGPTAPTTAPAGKQTFWQRFGSHHLREPGTEANAPLGPLARFSFRGVWSEFLAMTFLIFLACGVDAIYSQFSPPFNTANDATLFVTSYAITTAFTWAFAFGALVYAFGHLSAQLNPMVSMAMWIGGKLGTAQMLMNMVAQFLGAILGAALLRMVIFDPYHSRLGANHLTDGFSPGKVFAAEIIGTWILTTLVLMTLIHRDAVGVGAQPSPLPYALTVFAVAAILIPMDHFGTNLARSFGPALVANSWDKDGGHSHFWVWFTGPIFGAFLGGLTYRFFLARPLRKQLSASA